MLFINHFNKSSAFNCLKSKCTVLFRIRISFDMTKKFLFNTGILPITPTNLPYFIQSLITLFIKKNEYPIFNER